MLNEFRQDPVSGGWVLYATERGKRPHDIKKEDFYQALDSCVFEPERMAAQEFPVLILSHGRVVENLSADWTTVVIPNKFPAVHHGVCGPVMRVGPFEVAAGAGFHELVITRDHERSFAQFSDEETAEIILAYRTRYATIAQDSCGEYISVFHNHGRLAGASVYHSHSQIISMPMVPASILRHIEGARSYFEKTGTRIHEDLLAWEIKEEKRIVYQNEHFIALCPFVSRAPYEIKIFPKKHSSNFGDLADDEIPDLANALNVSLKKIYRALNNVDYAFFIHTAPPKSDDPTHDFYQWHIEIMPRFSIEAGLELETNVQVNTVDPDEAAELLRTTDA